MKVRSVDILEKELQDFLSNPHTTDNLKEAVNKAKDILLVNKKVIMQTMLLHFTNLLWQTKQHQFQIIQR